jgi:hypothetical protein
VEEAARSGQGPVESVEPSKKKNSMVNVIKKYTLYFDPGGPCMVPSVGPFSLIVE